MHKVAPEKRRVWRRHYFLADVNPAPARMWSPVKPGKTKTEPFAHNQFLGFRSGHLIWRPRWNQRAVKPGKTSTYRHRHPNGPTGDRVKPGKTKTELVTHMQLFGFPSGRLTRLPCRSRQAVKPGKTKNGRPGLPPPVILMHKLLISNWA